MPPDKPFALKPKQKLAVRLLGGTATHVLLRGGSRSGKSFVIAWQLITRAICVPGSFHGIFRRYRSDVKGTIFNKTLLQVLKLAYPNFVDRVIINKEDLSIKFPNGSETLCFGLGRVDKGDTHHR